MLIPSIILAALLAALQPGALGNDAHLTLTFDFPEDTTPEEKKSLIGRQLTLVGYSGLAHGPSFDTAEVEIDARYQIQVRSLKPWIYELKVDGVVRSREVDAALGPFRIQFDQFFYPQTGQPGFGRVKLERGIDLHGRVVDVSGNGVEGARVTARWSRRSIHGNGVQQIVESGPGGAFRFINVPSNMSSVESVKAPWPTARLTKRALAAMIRKKEPVEITHAALGPSKGSAPEKKEAKKGSLESLGRGEILGRLQDASGKPMAEASLRLVPLLGSRLSMSEKDRLGEIGARTDGSGAFEFRELPAISYELILDEPGLLLDPLHHSRALQVRAGEVLESTPVVAIAGGWIEATCLDQSGSTIDAADLSLGLQSHASLPIRHWREPSPALQSVRFGPLAPGKYRVTRKLESSDRHGRVALLQDVEVVAGEVATTTLDERGRRYDDFTNRCYGSVRLDGEPLLAAYVQLRDEIGEIARALTDIDGRFSLPVPKPGTYWLGAKRRPLGATAGQWVTLEASRSTTVHLELSRSADPSRPDDGFASGLCAAADLDGDQVGDLLVADTSTDLSVRESTRCLAISGRDGTVLFRTEGSRRRRSAIGLGSVGDLNGDGSPELVTRFSDRASGESKWRSGVELHSGATGLPMAEFVVPAERYSGAERFDIDSPRFDLLDDRDGDGIRDLCVITQQEASGGSISAAVTILSGARLLPSSTHQLFAVSPIQRTWWPGDLNGDGMGDLMVHAYRIGEEESRLLAFCGRTFERIEPWCATTVTDGQSLVAAAGDLDGDDVDDVFLADIDQVGIIQHKVTIKTASGSDVRELCSHVRTPNGTGGEDLVSLPDLDGDGKGDVLLTSHGFSLLLAEPAVVSVHSGADLSLLYELQQTTSPRAVYEHFGISGCCLDDVDGDGTADIAIRAMTPYGAGLGCVEIYSGSDGSPIQAITRKSAYRVN